MAMEYSLSFLQRVRRSSGEGHVEVLLCRSCGASAAGACSFDVFSPPCGNGGLAAPIPGAEAAHEGEAAQKSEQAGSCTAGTEHDACVAELPSDLRLEIQRHGAELRKVRAMIFLTSKTLCMSLCVRICFAA